MFSMLIYLINRIMDGNYLLLDVDRVRLSGDGCVYLNCVTFINNSTQLSVAVQFVGNCMSLKVIIIY